jgi:hypothetical protein
MEQLSASLLAIPAFIPATFCTGYAAAWLTDLHSFRQRSLVERVFWSIPLSMAISAIASELIGKALSLSAVIVFFEICTLITVVAIVREDLQLRRSGSRWKIGWSPYGGTSLILGLLWIALVVLSLIDLESNHQLFMNVSMLDLCYRINWTESILRTGIPPANSLYLYRQPASMRNYYFWYVICAAVAKMAHLSVRAVFTASCVWAGFSLAAVNGLYLKHFLEAGARLRRQFLRSVFLLTVTGLDIFVAIWDLFYLHQPPASDLEAWSKDGIVSWLHTLLWAPHHVVSMVCCMLAFLLAWMAGKPGGRNRAASVILIALALASAFGLSVYVAFAFFLVMLAWAVWQIVIERTSLPALLLAAGGAGAVLLLVAYLSELTHTQSKMAGGSLFCFAVREMFSPDGLLATHFFQQLAAGHPLAALNLAKLLLLVPGYAIELGFYVAVLLIYLVPAWRGRTPLTPAQRTLVFIAAVTLPFISFIRSGVLETNDFGWRGALFVQFPLLLLASEILTSWNLAARKAATPADFVGLPRNTPHWLRSLAALALIVGVVGVFCQALMLRFIVPMVEAGHRQAVHDSETGNLSHNFYISTIGYAELDAAIPQQAIVQFNPNHPSYYWATADILGVDHQTAIINDRDGCGSAIGGDPSGCPLMAAAIDSLYLSGTADQARAVCRDFGIQYLIARIYDPVWKDKGGWVWTLPPVVSDEQFRALDCNQ